MILTLYSQYQSLKYCVLWREGGKGGSLLRDIQYLKIRIDIRDKCFRLGCLVPRLPQWGGLAEAVSKTLMGS